MDETLNPYESIPLHEQASVNRQRLHAVPAFGEAYRGQLAYDVLRRKALVELATNLIPELAEEADPLPKLPEHVGDPRFDRLAQEFGARIATLVCVLRDGHRENRETRPLWNEAAWDFWAARETIWLAGGLLEGPFGEAVVTAAGSLVGRRPRLVLSPFRRHAPMIGAARSILDRERVRVLDFGQTTLKRGTAKYANGMLTEVHLEEGLAVPFDPPVEVMEDLLAEACRDWRGSVSMSMASYEAPGGGPVDAGDFGKFYRRTKHVPSYLESLLGVEKVVMIHDGTAAALSLAGRDRSAVIVLGTALGIGVPPETDRDLAPFAPDFQLKQN